MSSPPPPAHAVFFPFPVQGHVSMALHLAKLLHARGGVRVTFVHSERNRRRVLRSRGGAALDGAPGFRFAAIPDGLPLSENDDGDAPPPGMVPLLVAIRSVVPHFRRVLDDLAAAGEPPTCVVTDMDHILVAATDMGLPTVLSWAPSPCNLLASLHYQQLIDRGLIPLKGMANLLSNGYMESTVVDWVEGMPADTRLRDFGSFVRTADADDAVLSMYVSYVECLRGTPSAVVLNTFDALEPEVVAALSRLLLPRPVYTVGPLPQLALARVDGAVVGASLWPEDGGCLEWLRGRPPRSVLYVNFGSIVVVTREQLVELAWGLARSGHDFVWVIRDDQAKGGGCNPIGMFPPEFAEEIKGRGYVTSWCPQEALLRHEAIGAFFTHCGWNSMLDGICNGIPMLCYPIAADQQTNCRYARTEWRIGVEVDENIERGHVDRMVREVMGDVKGKEMRRRAMGLKEKADMAVAPGGTSWINLENLINEALIAFLINMWVVVVTHRHAPAGVRRGDEGARLCNELVSSGGVVSARGHQGIFDTLTQHGCIYPRARVELVERERDRHLPCRRRRRQPPPTRCSSRTRRKATSRRRCTWPASSTRGAASTSPSSTPSATTASPSAPVAPPRSPAPPASAFAAVPDGLPLSDDDDGPPDNVELFFSIGSSVPHLRKILDDAAASGTPATCVVTDIDQVLLAASDMGLPAVAFWTTSACGLMALMQCKHLIERGIIPLKDAEQLSNGYLDSTVVDWVPGMPSDMRLRDFISFVRTTDPNDAVLDVVVSAMENLRTATSAVILNTFDELEGDVLAALSRIIPSPIYTVGPLPQLAAATAAASDVDASDAASLWPEDDACLEWLRTKPPRSVLYVNFGSIVHLTKQQLVELALGLAESGHDFLWVIRDDQAKIAGGVDPVDTFPPEFREKIIKGKVGYLTSWCPQEAALRHEAIGAFLTHCGWNSMLDSISNGVPMVCCPMDADQQTNCRYARTEWRVGVEIDDAIERKEVARMVREVMGEAEGKEMRQRAMEWKERAAMAVAPCGTSWLNIERLVNEVLSPHKKDMVESS
uniref:UDP-glycosyltransferases domain-containing protein n=1 Tax=Leersia perrieri TaxID=77586 RepID=A0A0D9VG33_9ORYZ